MLSSPISLVIGANTHSLKRINNDNFGSTYISKEHAGIEVRLNIRHSYENKNAQGQMERHNVDIQYTTFDENGIPTAYQSYMVIRNKRGASQTIPAQLIVALGALTATMESEIIDWES